jgi:hypothetical protein
LLDITSDAFCPCTDPDNSYAKINKEEGGKIVHFGCGAVLVLLGYEAALLEELGRSVIV